MLKPFASATKELSGTKYVTASLVVKTWKRLMITFKRLHSKDGVRTQGLTRSILCYLQEVWDKHLASSDSIWKVACTVDPNYKKLKFLNEEEKADAWDALVREMKTVGATLAYDDDAASPVHTDDDLDSLSEDSNGLDDADSPIGSSLTLSERIDIEIRSYKDQNIAKKEKPLQWWNANKETYKILSRVARVYLGINAASTQIERTFSAAKQLRSGRRNRTGAKLLGVMIYLNACSKVPWLWEAVMKASK
ncbi:hypothetical protein AAMO2058_000073400 [Amorphochlora amoebiformis]